MKKAARIYDHEGLFFRIPVEGDLETLRDLRNDSSTWVHLSDPRPLWPSDQKAWFGGIGRKSGRMYLVVHDEKHPFVGIIRLDQYDQQNRSLRIGLDVLPSLRGMGYGTRTYEALKAYAFDELNVHRLWLCVMETNALATKLYEKVGFKVEGRYRDAVFRHGQYIDYIVMSILEQEYRGEKDV